MRENRPSGSEGGVAMSHSYPYRVERAVLCSQKTMQLLVRLSRARRCPYLYPIRSNLRHQFEHFFKSFRSKMKQM